MGRKGVSKRKSKQTKVKLLSKEDGGSVIASIAHASGNVSGKVPAIGQADTSTVHANKKTSEPKKNQKRR